MTHRLFYRIIIALMSLFIIQSAYAETFPKREFRGVWIPTVGNTRFQHMTPQQIQNEWSAMLDTFQRAGMNAVIFQVRPEADAFYESKIEPWSRFLTGEQGKAPNPLWDPLAFMIKACHDRNMQLHAWLNPYRVTINDHEELSKMNKKHHKLFIKYGKQLFFDPGNPESWKIVTKVVADIVSRYDVDGIHFDDYFYPYPIKGEEFNDHTSFKKWGEKMGFKKNELAMWRRNNVDELIKEVSETVHRIKPWVVFGVSPFGIYRNAYETPDGSGSNTHGLSNYTDLNANVLLWEKYHWIDYVAPQLYWPIGHSSADYATLIKWWSNNTFGTNLYIGQSILTFKAKDLKDTTKTQFAEKMRLERETPNVKGNIWWSGYQLAQNPFGAVDSLADHYQKYPAFIPLYPNLNAQAPDPVLNLRMTVDHCQLQLKWDPAPFTNEFNKSAYFCIYRFKINEPINLNDGTHIVAIQHETQFTIQNANKKATFVITALNRLYNESSPSTPILTGN
ncbi:MAG: glycoside hydrolase family 10 protein [Microbacter sp.]